MGLKNKDAKNKDQHSKGDNNYNNNKKSPHESVSSTHLEFYNNNEINKCKRNKFLAKKYNLLPDGS